MDTVLEQTLEADLALKTNILISDKPEKCGIEMAKQMADDWDLHKLSDLAVAVFLQHNYCSEIVIYRNW
jgi:hypothetical protein